MSIAPFTNKQDAVSNWSNIILTLDAAEAEERHERLKSQGLLFEPPIMFPLGSKMTMSRDNCAVPDLAIGSGDNDKSVVIPSFINLEIVGNEIVGGKIVNNIWQRYERIYHVLGETLKGKQVWKFSEQLAARYFATWDYEPPINFSMGFPIEFDLCGELHKMKVCFSGKASANDASSMIWASAASRHEGYERLYVLMLNNIPMIALGDIEMQRMSAKPCKAQIINIAGGKMKLLKFCQENLTIVLTDFEGRAISDAHASLLKGEC